MGEVVVPGSRAELRAHLAVPVGSGPWPGLVVLHEAWGLTDDIRSIADRFASAGYLALAPDLYTSGGMLRCLVAALQSVRAGSGRFVDDIDASRRWLSGRSDCTGRTGVVGFCMGGGFALVVAARHGFAAAAPNYGHLPRDPEQALAGACPIVASYGGHDPALRGAAQRLEDVLTMLGVEHDVKEYPQAGHSFLNRHNLGPFGVVETILGFGHFQPAAEDAWRRMLEFLGPRLRG